MIPQQQQQQQQQQEQKYDKNQNRQLFERILKQQGSWEPCEQLKRGEEEDEEANFLSFFWGIHRRLPRVSEL